MTLPGETLASGAPRICPTCGVTVVIAVHRSQAGYYLGSYCHCGPYTRESRYYASEAEAQAALRDGEWVRR